MAAAEQLVRMGGGPRLDPHQDFRRPRWCKKCQVILSRTLWSWFGNHAPCILSAGAASERLKQRARSALDRNTIAARL